MRPPRLASNSLHCAHAARARLRSFALSICFIACACGILFGMAATSARATAQAAGGSSISGRIVDAQGDPLGGIQVLLFREDGDGIWDNR